MSPLDVLMGLQGIQPLLRHTGDSPVGFVGRLVGLGAEEQRAGVPKWACLGAGLIIGGALVWAYGEEAKRAVRALKR